MNKGLMKQGLILAILLSAATAVAQTATLNVYTGRGKGLVEPLVQQFERQSGIKVNVRYATDAALFAALQEEGAKSTADLFWANSSGTLGLMTAQLRALPDSLVKPFNPIYTPANNSWIPLSIRFRVLAFNTQKIKPEEMPKSVLDLPKVSSLKGRVGWTLGYASFQDFIGAMIALKGEAATQEWLRGMKALEPKDFGTSNTGMMEAIRSGQIDVALTNHYYIQRFIKSGAPIGTHYFAAGDPGSLALVTGVGILKTSKNATNAQKFLRYLAGKEAQQFFSSEVFEYPAVGKVLLSNSMLPFEQASKLSPAIDQEKLGARLEAAQKLLRAEGLL